MALNRSKYSQAPERDEWDEDLEWDKMSFNRSITAQQFQAREIAEEDEEYQLSRRQQSYQNRRVMDRVRPQVKPRGVRGW